MSTNNGNQSLDQLLECLYNTRETDIKVMLLCSDNCLKYLLLKVNQVINSREINKALHLTSRWLIVLTSNNDLKRVDDLMVNLNHLVNVAVLQAANNNSTSRSDVFHTSMASNQVATISSLYFGGGNLRYLNDVAIVTTDLDIVLLGDHGIFPNAHFLLNKRKLIVSIAQWPPFVIQDKEGVYSGFNMDILKYLESLLNFTSILVDSTDKEWGNKEENGTYTGLIGQLQRKEVDVLMAPVAVDTDRDHVMDFTFPYFTDYTTVVLKKPDPNLTKWLTLIEPFTWQAPLVSLALVPASVTRLDPASVTRLVPASVTRLVPASVTRLDPASVTRLVPASVTRLVPASVTRLDPASVTRLVPASVTRLDPTSVTRLDPASVTRLVPASVTRLDPASVTRLVPASVTRLVPASVTRLDPASVTRLDTHVLLLNDA
ncbi:hypothetical protein Btru_036743 [Bulinus truncatus]|nr:hypothetical protein Btru_036743 [Bulinus truncatus]